MSAASFTPSNTRGHAALFYESPDEQLETLAQFFREGVEQNELCIYVSTHPAQDIIEKFSNLGFRAQEAVAGETLRIFEMDATYMPNGKFVADYMLHNLKDFLADAAGAGYKGLRTAGDMSWIHEHPDAEDEAFTYEVNVNGFSNEQSNFMGLCLYPMHSTQSSLMPNILRAHPSVIYGGEVQTNAQYRLPA